jgi:chemotaxis protein methyltransferase CheR
MDIIIIHDSEYQRLLVAIHEKYGYDFSGYADVSVRRRISHFMHSRNMTDVGVLEKSLLNDDELFEQFLQGLSVTVTEMFRDPLFFKSLRENVTKRLATYPVIKIWIAGCATGEEAYSMAILLNEEGLLNRTIIYATDINQHSLQIAKEGVYPLSGMRKYTENYIQAGGKRSFSDYYVAKYDAVLLDKTLKQNIVFSPHNLTADKSFNEFQLILCRNVLMYFNQVFQTKVISLFYDSLANFAFLGLGDKESLLFADKRNFFEPVDNKQKIYMKVS